MVTFTYRHYLKQLLQLPSDGQHPIISQIYCAHSNHKKLPCWCCRHIAHMLLCSSGRPLQRDQARPIWANGPGLIDHNWPVTARLRPAGKRHFQEKKKVCVRHKFLWIQVSSFSCVRVRIFLLFFAATHLLLSPLNRVYTQLLPSDFDA